MAPGVAKPPQLAGPGRALVTVERGIRRVPVWAVWLLGGVPLVWLIWLGMSDGLGVDPVKEVEHRLGKIALWFLVGGLAISPLRRWGGVNLLRFRRAIGLLGFAYVVLHVVVWLVLDMGLLWSQALRDLTRRPYLLFGLAALLLLLPLAITSNRAAIRKLGRNWGRLHRLVYPAVALSVLHYLWQMKVIRPEGWIWLAALTGLLLLRPLLLRRRSA